MTTRNAGDDWAVTTGFTFNGVPIVVVTMQRTLRPVIVAAKRRTALPWFENLSLFDVQAARIRDELPLGPKYQNQVLDPYLEGRLLYAAVEAPPSAGEPEEQPDLTRPLVLREPYYPPVVVEVADPQQALFDLSSIVEQDDALAMADVNITRYLLEEVPVPVFGSPPQALIKLGSAMSALAPGAAILLPSAPNMPTASHAIIAGAASTIWVTFGKPTLRVSGIAYQRWLQRRLGVTAADIRRYGN